MGAEVRGWEPLLRLSQIRNEKNDAVGQTSQIHKRRFLFKIVGTNIALSAITGICVNFIEGGTNVAFY